MDAGVEEKPRVRGRGARRRGAAARERAWSSASKGGCRREGVELSAEERLHTRGRGALRPSAAEREALKSGRAAERRARRREVGARVDQPWYQVTDAVDSYECGCRNGNQVYIRGENVFIYAASSMSRFSWLFAIWSCPAPCCRLRFYKYMLRSYMDLDIMAIMSQYMPLDSQNNEQQLLRQQASET